MATGLKSPITRNSHIAAAKAQQTCFPIPSSCARRYDLIHQLKTAIKRHALAIKYKPPSQIGGKPRPYSSPGGSREIHHKSLHNACHDQSTDWSMPIPVKKNQAVPRKKATVPNIPK